MIKFIRENKLWTVVLILFIVIPLFIQMHWLPFYQIGAFLTPGNHGNWLQFWGSYFGFVPTGVITFMVLKFQFKRQEVIDKNNFDEQLKKQKQEFLFEQEVLKIIELQRLSIDNYQTLKYFKENITIKREETLKKWDITWKKTEDNRSIIQLWQDSLIAKRFHNFEGVDTNLSFFSDFNDISEKKHYFDEILSIQPNALIEEVDLVKLISAVSDIADNYSNIYNILVEYEVTLEEGLSA